MYLQVPPGLATTKRRSLAAVRYVEFATAPILAVTMIFSYVKGEYGTAVICGVCAGLVAGLQVGRQFK